MHGEKNEFAGTPVNERQVAQYLLVSCWASAMSRECHSVLVDREGGYVEWTPQESHDG